MIPKLKSAVKAVKTGTKAVYITNLQNLNRLAEHEEAGTRIIEL
jgi:acetylglutamate kinase